jgi:hypothetical protein
MLVKPKRPVITAMTRKTTAQISMVLPSFKGYKERSDVKIIKKIRTVNAHLSRWVSGRNPNKFPPGPQGGDTGGMGKV